MATAPSLEMGSRGCGRNSWKVTLEPTFLLTNNHTPIVPRLKDLVNMGCLNLKGVSYLVLDEADRMLDQGFEDDIREIIGMTHPGKYIL